MNKSIFSIKEGKRSTFTVHHISYTCFIEDPLKKRVDIVLIIYKVYVEKFTILDWRCLKMSRIEALVLIEKLRAQLIDLAQHKSLIDPELVKLSQTLDSFLNLYPYCSE